MNRETEFENFLMLEKTINSKKAVSSRMSKARKAEDILGQKLDIIVSDDNLMYDSLVALKPHEDPAHTPMQNAVRKYYKFWNGKEFPQLRYYRR
ncbi:hypothetical protein RWV98_07095 [Agathobaculum sp. NTUH-O15-33]|uniref:hypothetical protein n=1 Tax=Agathobaculum sp. NTUH-O15-33 TaxID=3079302 RepID=UPI0029585F18|nr:hypothetical protein [Agathobaculum sp. NTUH-O15-33]WNX86030.1 hypothetical protein RWV98_07095 [Agathobaculum sp. NTUH-O15-33]